MTPERLAEMDERVHFILTSSDCPRSECHAARTDLPEAIAEIKRLQRRVEELEGGTA